MLFKNLSIISKNINPNDSNIVSTYATNYYDQRNMICFILLSWTSVQHKSLGIPNQAFPEMDKIEHNLEDSPPTTSPFKQRLKERSYKNVFDISYF